MSEGKLTALGVKKLTKPGFHGDGGGLYFRIGDGRRSWLFRYKQGGKTHWFGLGAEGDFTLAEARDAARECRRQLKAHIDPIEARRAAKAAAAAQRDMTFKTVAEQYIAAHRGSWRNAKHAAQWPSTLESYAYPLIGKRPVQSITAADVLAVIEPIWQSKPETAGRVRGRIETVLDYATSRHMRTGENPARWRGHLEHSLPARSKVAKVVHHAALSWTALPDFMSKLAQSKGTAALCLRFLVLNTVRSGEARGATWREIDMAEKTWTVPGDRMKAGRDHRIPLNAPALAILEYMASLGTDPDQLVFEGGKRAKPLSDVALNKALATAGGKDATVHGMRSTFREWCAEQTNYPREIAETALAHINRDRVEAAYLRGDHFEQRRRLMDEWSAFCTGTGGQSAAETPSRKRA